MDCEFLKKCCETLTDENRRLQKELQELRALKLAQPLYMPMPAATLTMCPSCERLGGGGASNKSPFSLAPKPHFFSPFTNPSAACWLLLLLGFHFSGYIKPKKKRKKKKEDQANRSIPSQPLQQTGVFPHNHCICLVEGIRLWPIASARVKGVIKY